MVWPCSLPASQETRCIAPALPFLFPKHTHIRSHSWCPLLPFFKAFQTQPPHQPPTTRNNSIFRCLLDGKNYLWKRNLKMYSMTKTVQYWSALNFAVSKTKLPCPTTGDRANENAEMQKLDNIIAVMEKWQCYHNSSLVKTGLLYLGIL